MSRVIWTKKNKDGNGTPVVPGKPGATVILPKGEPPLCCPETKTNPTPSPVERGDPRSPKGVLVCEPKQGGCGSTFTPEDY